MGTNHFSCSEANKLDLVVYLEKMGHFPKKIRNDDYWYLSPLRDEKEPSFKINRKLNLWYDHGSGQGGNLVDFGVLYHKCSVKDFLNRLSESNTMQSLSFHPQNSQTSSQQNPKVKSTAGEKKESGSGKILILDNRTLASPFLLQYLQRRYIPIKIAEKFCKEIDFELYDKKYTAIGFRNDKGGYELRSENFKGSSSPKAPTFFEYDCGQVAVFEGFFDFLSFHTLIGENAVERSNVLVLNSLAFISQTKSIMDKHEIVNLYLDRNKQGMGCTQMAIKWDEKKYSDRSEFLRLGQDINDWLIERKIRQAANLIPKINHQQGKGRKI